MLELNGFYNMDCMDGMKQFPDKYFELAITDPPYFKGPNKRKFYGAKVNKLNIKRKDYPVIDNWEIPTAEYFNELIRVSKHQIIWGCNYFNYTFPVGRIVWDKCNGDSTFSDCEIAFCSVHNSTRLFRYMWNGMIQENMKNKEFRIHPTQKPVKLYEWLLSKYANVGDKILDTHVGSASSLIACHRMGFEYIGFELDKDYFNPAKERLEAEKAQVMFNM